MQEIVCTEKIPENNISHPLNCLQQQLLCFSFAETNCRQTCPKNIFKTSQSRRSLKVSFWTFHHPYWFVCVQFTFMSYSVCILFKNMKKNIHGEILPSFPLNIAHSLPLKEFNTHSGNKITHTHFKTSFSIF